MKISKITIEGMHNVDRVSYQFAPVLNYFHGKNGAGKSTILQSIQLALLGYIPGTKKTNQAIFEHANSHTMAVTLELDDGSTIRRIWTKSGKQIKSTIDTNPETLVDELDSIVEDIELPIFNFGDMLNSTANSQKDWWMKFLPSATKDIDWNTELSNAVADMKIENDYIQDSAKHIQNAYSSVSGLEQVRGANSWFKQTLSLEKSNSSRIANALQTLTHYDDTDPTLDVDAIRARITKLNQDSKLLANYNWVVMSNKGVLDQLTTLDNLYDGDMENARTIVEDLTKKIGEVSEKIKDTESKYISANSDYLFADAACGEAQKVMNGSHTCPYTSENCDAITKHIDTAQKKFDEASKQREEALVRKNQLYKELENLRTKYRTLGVKLNEVQRDVQSYDNLRSKVTQVPNVDGLESTDVDFYEKEINRLQDQLVKYRANEEYDKLYQSLTRDKFTIDQNIQALKAWDTLTGVNGLQNHLMRAPFEMFAENMDKYISEFFGEGVTTKFNLTEKSSDFSFGIVRNGVYIPFEVLSSGEKCMFTLAMQTCIVAESKSPIKVVMIDDLFDHLDYNNIQMIMDSVSTSNNANLADVQFIFAGVTPVTLSKAEGDSFNTCIRLI